MNTTGTPPGSTRPQPPAPAPTVWPALICRDAYGMIDFLVSTFGFEATAVYGDGTSVQHGQLDWPEGGGIMLGSGNPNSSWQREPGTAGIYLVTDRVQQIHERCRANGVQIIEPLKSTDYDPQTFAVSDPEGNYWSFGTYRGEPRST